MQTTLSWNHLSFSYLFPFLELSTLPARTFLHSCLSRNTLNEHIYLRIGMLPIAHIELAYLSMSAVYDKRVLAVVRIKVIVIDSVNWFHFGVWGNHSDLVVCQAKLLKKFQICNGPEATWGKGCGQVDRRLSGFLILNNFILAGSLIVLRSCVILKLPKDMLSWLISFAVTSANFSLADVGINLLNSFSSRKHPDLLVTPMTFSLMLKHCAISFCNSAVWSDLATVIFLFWPLNLSWIWYIMICQCRWIIKSDFQHSALLLRRAPCHWLLAVRPLLMITVFALLTFAVLATLEAGLVAFTVFLEAVGFLAVAALDVLVILDFLAEGIGIAIHKRHYCVVSLLLVDVQVVAAHTVAAFAGLVEAEAIAVEL